VSKTFASGTPSFSAFTRRCRRRAAGRGAEGAEHPGNVRIGARRADVGVGRLLQPAEPCPRTILDEELEPARGAEALHRGGGITKMLAFDLDRRAAGSRGARAGQGFRALQEATDAYVGAARADPDVAGVFSTFRASAPQLSPTSTA